MKGPDKDQHKADDTSTLAADSTTTATAKSGISSEQELNSRLAVNIIGSDIASSGNEADLNQKEIKEACSDLGKSILNWQDSVINGSKPDNTEINEKIRNLVLVANNKKKDNLAMESAAGSEMSRIEARVTQIQNQFEAAEKDPKSALNISTHNRALVVTEYKRITEKENLSQSKAKGWEKSGADSDQEKGLKKNNDGTYSMVCRTENDGRILARKLAEENHYNPNDSFYIKLDKFEQKKSGRSWYQIEAAVGFMREHRKYGAIGTFRLGEDGDTSLSQWANSEHNPIVEYNATTSMQAISGQTFFWRQSPARQAVALDLTAELALNEARQAALEDNPNLDLTNLAAVNAATLSKLADVVENAYNNANPTGPDAVPNESNMFYKNEEMKGKVIKAAMKSLQKSTTLATLDQLENSETIKNDKSSNPLEQTIKFNTGNSITDMADSKIDDNEPKQHNISFTPDKGFGIIPPTTKQIKEVQNYNEYSISGVKIDLPNNLKTFVDNTFSMPIWGTKALIDGAWNATKTLTKGVAVGLGTGIYSFFASGYRMMLWKKSETTEATLAEKFNQNYKYTTDVCNSVSEGFGKIGIGSYNISSVKHELETLESTRNLLLDPKTEISLYKGVGAITNNVSSFLYNSLPAMKNNSIRHNVSQLFGAKQGWLHGTTQSNTSLDDKILDGKIDSIAKYCGANLDNYRVRRLVASAIPNDFIENYNLKAQTYEKLSKGGGSDITDAYIKAKVVDVLLEKNTDKKAETKLKEYKNLIEEKHALITAIKQNPEANIDELKEKFKNQLIAHDPSKEASADDIFNKIAEEVTDPNHISLRNEQMENNIDNLIGDVRLPSETQTQLENISESIIKETTEGEDSSKITMEKIQQLSSKNPEIDKETLIEKARDMQHEERADNLLKNTKNDVSKRLGEGERAPSIFSIEGTLVGDARFIGGEDDNPVEKPRPSMSSNGS
jgi:hypothetical protein